MAEPTNAGAAVVRLKVWRGVAGTPGRFEEYAVPFEPGQSVLDALIWVRQQRDATLAARYSCLNANSCKECLMQIDGRTAYACTTRLVPGGMQLEPLPNKAWLRDLVTEIAPPDERLKNDPT